ncbi:MAG: hypothetical protein V4604_10725 [Bacteroidota bacterium]
MSDSEAQRFIEKNLPNFSLNGKGWHALIRDMLFEFWAAGWDVNTNVYGKEKFGELRCYSVAENELVNRLIPGIVRKYTSLSLKTCETCGNNGIHRIVNSWEVTLCLEHYMERLPTISIVGNKISVGEKVFDMSRFHRAEFQREYRIVQFYTRDRFRGEEFLCAFSWQLPNYYALLRQVPSSVFTDEQTQALSGFFNSLSNCEACGHVAVHEDYCRRCYCSIWDESDLDCYENKTEYIKERQMDNFLDRSDHMALFKNDTSFEKVPGHKILFTQEELEIYKQECEDDEDGF